MARTFGITVHTLLELLATELARGQLVASLLAELPTWRERIAVLLRSGGVPPNECSHLIRDVYTALHRTLTDPKGLWLLQSRPTAESEFGFNTGRDGLVTRRVDRLFVAGDEPLSAGDNSLWIVDYKTVNDSHRSSSQFLKEQRALYAEQLETYADLLHGLHQTDKTRVALYFPTQGELVWWTPRSLGARPIVADVGSAYPENDILRDVRGVVSDPFEIA